MLIKAPKAVTLLAFVLAAGAAAGRDGEVTVYPQDSDWWTGVCYEYGRQQSGEIEWWQPELTRHNGWVKFDLAAIPDTVEVTSARLHYRVTAGTGSPQASIRKCAVDPVPNEGPAIYSSINSGAEFGTGDGYSGWHTVYLNAQGVAHVQECLARDWVAFGFRAVGTGTNWARAVGHSGQDRPYLVLNCVAQAVAEPRAGAPLLAFDVRPSVTSGGRVEVVPGAGLAGPARLVLVDAAGRAVLEQAVEPSGARLDLRGVKPGAWFVLLEAAGQTAVRKLLVQD